MPTPSPLLVALLFLRSRCALLAVLVLLGLLACVACSSQQPTGESPLPDCRHCHRRQTEDGNTAAPLVPKAAFPDHDLPCQRCHLPPPLREGPVPSHDKVISHPATLRQAPQQCGPCHDREIEKLSGSLHATMAGIINQTRYLWGAQASAHPPRYGVATARGRLAPLPQPVSKALLDPKPERLVDDFLRRRCLRCHIDAEPPPNAPNATALQRGQGCAACHEPHPEHYQVAANSDAATATADTAASRSSRSSPSSPSSHRSHNSQNLRHSSIEDARCLSCHNNNHTGADSHGLFMRDTDDWFQKAVIHGRQVPAPYGSGQIRLAGNLHTERGLWCVDCHGQDDVMGAGGPPEGFALQTAHISCSGCHGGWGDQLPPDSLRIAPDGSRVLAGASGRDFRVPLFSTDHPAHDPAAHQSLRCDACHGLWSYQDYGLEALYQEGGDFQTWRYLTRQGDPFVERALLQVMERENPKNQDFVPDTPDHVSGGQRPGVWLLGWRFRRWDAMPLGRDHKGRVAVLRPRHQYRVSAVDHRGVCVLDGAVPQRGDGSGRGWAFMPQVLHAIAPQGRPCGACHGNAQAAGLGHDLGALQALQGMSPQAMNSSPRIRDLALTTPQPPAVAGMELLSMLEAEALLTPPLSVRRRMFAQRRPWLEAVTARKLEAQP